MGNFLKRLLFSGLLLAGACAPAYATQSVFTDPSAGSCTDPGTGNTGNGTCTISVVTAFNPTEAVTFTATTAGSGATFAVSGATSGPLGTITAGSTQVVVDSYGFAHFSVNLSNGGTPYIIGDDFTVTITAGTELKKASFDLLTLAQICSNGCTVSTSLTANSVIVGSSANVISGLATIINGAGTLTLPTSTDTIVGRATSDTLTNKSINSSNNTITNIANVSVSSSAAIDGTKISPDFGSQNIVTTGTLATGSPTFSATAKFADGSVTIPSEAFSSDADGSGTGIYRVGANSLGFAANGVNVGSYTSSGGWTFGSSGGTATTTANTNNFQMLGSSAGAATLYVFNANNANAAAHAVIEIQNGGASAGDAYIRFDDASNAWSIGPDRSDSGAFKITESTSLNTTADYFRIASGGAVTIGKGSATQHTLNTLLATNGAQAATLLNLPAAATAGNPAGWAKFTINGTTSYVPFWQ